MIEKKTRKLEIDEHNGCHIHVRETTHLVDENTGEIIHDSVSHHRFVIDCDDDDHAADEGLTEIANIVWTKEARKHAKLKKKETQNDQRTK